MSGAINFKRSRKAGDKSRLQVGWLSESFSLVWYEPIGDAPESKERGPEIGLFNKAQGDDSDESPMLDQVIWAGYYEPTKGESKRLFERNIIQQRDLYLFWKYMNSTDADEIEEMDERLDNPRKSRRFAFWEQAKKIKRREMNRRAKRRRKNEALARTAGVDPVATGLNSDSSEEDSAYETDEEERLQRAVEKKRKRVNSAHSESMPPPKRPGKQAVDRRKASHQPKTPRASFGSRPTSEAPMFMSGGLASRRRTDTPIDDSGSDYDFGRPQESASRQYTRLPYPGNDFIRTQNQNGLDQDRLTGFDQSFGGATTYHGPTVETEEELEGELAWLRSEGRAQQHMNEQRSMGLNEDETI